MILGNIFQTSSSLFIHPKLNGFKYCYLTVIILFNIFYSIIISGTEND